ncbi:hypothetical protein [Novipirellula artificiosorum]|uniref:Type IV pilin biogenesis protein n=1 Tax=Novipirellula artificiosorum TaxID=2528016 RepID=A0A5C6DB64_9BACT|nr:hypothetical protein [Novipirellula artificiosorum]TWU32987.1 hypothetical protein Poly41_53660 [Novipirellula artificiosorum]
MQTTSKPLDRILTWNDQLLGLSAAGIPIDFGGASASESVTSSVEKINAALTLAVARGQTVAHAIEHEALIPDRYRQAALTLLRTADATVPLDMLTTPARTQRELTMNLSRWFFQVGLVFALALLGFIYLIFAAAPRIRAYFGSLGLSDGPLAFLTFARETFWGWLLLLIAGFAAAVWLWRKHANQIVWSVFPGGKRYQDACDNADTASHLANLMQREISLDDALLMSGRTTDSMPPLLRWAVQGDLEGEPRDRALQFVAKTYQQKAAYIATLWRFVVPAVAASVVGGAIVLAYALALFLPWLHFLEALT